MAVKVVTVCAGPHPSHARPPSDTPGGPGPAAAAARRSTSTCPTGIDLFGPVANGRILRRLRDAFGFAC